MLDPVRMLCDGVILSIVDSIYLMRILYLNPRLLLQDYPKAVQEAAPPKTAHEARLSTICSGSVSCTRNACTAYHGG